MFKKLIIMALFAMVWAVPVAYAVPPGHTIAYTTQTDSIATMQNEPMAHAVTVAYKRFTNLF